MVREIVKKVWPSNFNSLLLGRRNCDLRLNDFRVSEDDIIVFKEWDPEKKRFTGRIIKKVVKHVNNINVFDYYSITDLKKRGLLLVELLESIE